MPKVSQLLTRVLAREHDGRDDGSSSSGSEIDYRLQHMAANASAGLRMEMEMARESRARDAEDGVDRNACIVDRSQFFNTQIGVGYQHKTVVRQRTAEPRSSGHRVIDMSVENRRSNGRKRRRERGTQRDSAGDSDGSVDEGATGDKARKRSSKSAKSKKSKSKRRDRDGGHASKKERKSKKEKRQKKGRRRRESSKSTRRERESPQGESSSDDNSNVEEQRARSSSRSRKHKKKITSHTSHSRKRSSGRDSRDFGSSEGKPAPRSSSSSSTSGSSDSGSNSDDDEVKKNSSDVHNMLPPSTATGGGDEHSGGGDGTEGNTIDKARAPLQLLRNLIEEKLKAKARASKNDSGGDDKSGLL